MVTKRLGRGLQALIPDINAVEEGRADSIREVELSRIIPNPFQPRSDFDSQALEELKQSIAANGIITPITVRSYNSGYQLIAGERRLRAVQELGYTSIPAYILDIKDERQLLELALIENVQRENLNPIEEARGYQRLIEDCQLTQEIVAQKVGKDRVTIANALRLLKLPDSIQESLRKGELTAGHGRALLGLPDRARQIELWKKTLKSKLSVRQLERLVQQATRLKTSAKKKPVVPYAIREAEDKMRRIFGTQVRIHLKGKGGTIELEFYSENDLERLLELMQR
ncbi:MAG: ParB/RepB/Spo0J family partition protein [candidate division KSB1 bacterium]|nr:ParB/RepB/Spo0J family partition protein [candidate division KSB1 bacterium]